LTVTTVAVLGLGSAGAIFGYRLKVPAGVLVGAIAGISGGTFILGAPPITVPPEINQALQILIGILVGLRISRDSLRLGLRSMIPASVITASMIVTGVLSALIAVSTTPVKLSTALFAAAPGGMTEMSAVGASYGANGVTVATVHLARLLLAIVIVNLVLARLRRKVEPSTRYAGTNDGLSGRSATKARSLQKAIKQLAEPVMWLALAGALGTLGGLAGLASQLPAGGVVGALLFSAAVRLATTSAIPVRKFQLGIQALSGGVIGLGVSGDLLDKAVQIAGTGAIVIAAQLLLWYAMSRLLVKAFHQEALTALFTSAPGGMSELIATANQAGANTVVVAFAHLLRLSATIVVIPTLFAVLFAQ
jgi:membrane AbrB-like protein